MNRIRRAAIVPGGAWGTALAVPLAANGIEVTLWQRRAEAALAFASAHTHAHLPGVTLPPAVTATADLAAAVADADLVVLAPPSDALRAVLTRLRPLVPERTLLVSVTKGLEPESLLRMTEVIAAELPDHAHITALSGPNFAIEVARRLPTASVVAGRDLATAAVVQSALMTADFRVYTHHDLIGLELGGALKNVVALAAGVAEGLNIGYNANAALITRGLAEIARLGVAMGAHPLTFAGLAGMGDLVLTCTGTYSRNRRAGLMLGRGAPLAQVLDEVGVVEGVRTTRAALALSQRFHVPMPVTEQVHRILFDHIPPRDGVMALMTRERAHELESAGTAEGDRAMESHLSLYLRTGGKSRNR